VCDSDLIVFAAPLRLAGVVYGAVLFSSSWLRPRSVLRRFGLLFKEYILAPVDLQCAWLRLIGFQDVDCFFKVFELALFGGRKAPGHAL
jgi:hypothetical protein